MPQDWDDSKHIIMEDLTHSMDEVGKRLRGLSTKLNTIETGAQVNVAYTLERLTTPTSGYSATYILKKNGVQEGDAIDIPKDYLVKSGSVETVTTADTPYTGAVAGDKYLDFVVNTAGNDGTATHLYIPVNDLVDVYSNATTSSDGLMSSADKTKLDGVATGAQVNVLEGVQLSGTDLSITNKKVNIPPATPSAAGLMSAEQVVALNSKATVSNNVTLYVAPDGNDTTGDGTSEKPFATVNRALDELGDVCSSCYIRMKAGTYNWTNETWGGKHTHNYAIDCVKVGFGQVAVYIIADSNTNDVVINISDDVATTVPLYRGGVNVQGCRVTLQKIQINYSGTAGSSNYFPVCLNTKVNGTLYLSNSTATIEGNKNVMCGATHTGLVVVPNTSSVGFKDVQGNIYYGAYAYQGGNIVFFGNVKSDTGFCPPSHGNVVSHGGFIQMPSNGSWGATVAENTVNMKTLATLSA